MYSSPSEGEVFTKSPGKAPPQNGQPQASTPTLISKGIIVTSRSQVSSVHQATIEESGHQATAVVQERFGATSALRSSEAEGYGNNNAHIQGPTFSLPPIPLVDASESSVALASTNVTMLQGMYPLT